jgi:CYTH domain-containing protein
MSKKLEIERRFIVKFPSSWTALASMLEGLIDIKRICQTYLKPKGEEQSGRVRKTVAGLADNKKTVYHFNQKKPVATGVHQELEKEISLSQYQKYLTQAHPEKVSIDKTRFLFRYKDQIFELDIFKVPLKGLAILEIELSNKSDPIRFPPFLTLVQEVTDNSNYTNYALASKQLHLSLKNK